MLKLCKYDHNKTIESVMAGKLDNVKPSHTNLVDDIIFAMYNEGVLDAAFNDFPDKRRHNTTVPFKLVMALACAAKMKINTSLTDIPYAISDHRVISSLGYNLESTEGFMTEGAIRHLIGKYSWDELFNEYNEIVQNRITPLLDIEGNVHILDCTKLEVNFDNHNYESAGVVEFEGKLMRGYKLSTIRTVIEDTGIIQDVRFGPINVHDLALSREMLLTSPVLKPGDILINDRGFLSRELINTLKTERGVDSYVPLRRNMDACKGAILFAVNENKWRAHPNKRRTKQKVSDVIEISTLWRSENPDSDVPILACVVWDELKNDYHVFTTTNVNASAADIIKTYEIRPEIEEDYRQLKDFWKMEDFKSTKLNVIAFHVVSVLLGYLFFHLYTLLPEGEALAGKSFPVVQKNYTMEVTLYYLLYAEDTFTIVGLLDLMKLYADGPNNIKAKFGEVLGQNAI